MRLDRDARDFVHGWIDYIVIGADITDDFEYDIVDEYDGTIERMKSPVNYVIDRDEEKIYIISINYKALEQHERQRGSYAGGR